MRNLLQAIRPLANDLFSSLVFAVLIAIGAGVTVATASAIAIGIGHVILMKVLKRPIAALQWASLVLVLTLGSASLYLHDPRFLMVKPTVVYLIIAAVMLRRGWMLRYMPSIARGHGEPLMIVFGYVWAGLMILTAASNLIIAIYAPALWPAYLATFPLGSKLALFAIQFLTVRAYVKPRVEADMAARAAA